ncbi:hypothetical protein H2198_006914 [Neophaeococcomyces mojaviensis]|uniref:Uncharacterized protein n=1 Tax=Neophaeococcomyces mojaviensis TaxID=3383035 RepID=A0ACC3A202_9EURO|nr:hypothetical protein H2198_006914 [Knufia sp. JES_112]
MAPHAGVIIAASVLVAAGIAAYESPQFREWLDRSSQKVAMAFRSIGNDVHSRSRSKRQDPTMQEDVDEKAEERRKKARDEIMEKGRTLQEQRKRRRLSSDNSRTPSFDSIVDEDGRLRADPPAQAEDTMAASSAVEIQETESLRSRHENPQMHQSVDAPMLLRQLDPDQRSTPAVQAIEPWESQYEQEMRNAWNIDLSARSAQTPPSHASESLIDLTPTTEGFPDPDYSIPSAEDLQNRFGRTEYFSAAASQTSHTLSNDPRNPFRDIPGDQPLPPLMPIEPRPLSHQDMPSPTPSSHASMEGSTAHINHSEAEMTDDDLSEFGDGIRTPASAWTEVGSSVSGDD